MSKYIYQNDERCLKVIQDVGCFFRSALHIVELYTGYFFEPSEINALWESAKKKDIIDDDNNLRNSARLMNLALKYVKPLDKSYFAEIGLKKNGIFEAYQWADIAGLIPNYFIKKYKQNGKSKVHFVVVDKIGKTIFDPHNPGITERGDIYIICYKLIEK